MSFVQTLRLCLLPVAALDFAKPMRISSTLILCTFATLGLLTASSAQSENVKLLSIFKPTVESGKASSSVSARRPSMTVN